MSGFDDKYKKRPGTAVHPVEALKRDTVALVQGDKKEYKAFNSTAHPEFELHMRTNGANPHSNVSIPYSHRCAMFDDGDGFGIAMHFSGGPILSVTVQGRGLSELHWKLMKHEVEWIQEFDPKKHLPVPEGEPCILGLDIKFRPVPKKQTDTAPVPEEAEQEKAPSRH